MTSLVDSVNGSDPAIGFEISEEIHTLRHLYNAQRYRAFRKSGGEIPHMEGRVLYYVANTPGATLRDLSAHLMRDKAQIARVIAALRNDDILESQVDPDDRRVQRLFLTTKGSDMFVDVKRERMLVAQRGVSKLSDAERRQLLALLQKVKAGLEAED